jgi:predicted peroxiredoxin
MAEQARDLTVVITHGIDHEMSSVALTLARGGITAGMRVSIFLTSAGVDLVRRRGTDMTHVTPLDPLREQIADFLSRGGIIWSCPPCTKSRGYEQSDLIDGVVIAGGAHMHKLIAAGGATLCF